MPLNASAGIFSTSSISLMMFPQKSSDWSCLLFLTIATGFKIICIAI